MEERLQVTSQMMQWWDQDHSWAYGTNEVSGEEAGKVEIRRPRILSRNI